MIRVLIIYEDERLDKYLVEPIVKKLFQSIEKTAKVRSCSDPKLRGINDALDSEILEEIVGRYGKIIDLFLLIVDRDDRPSRREKLNNIQCDISKKLERCRCLIAECAHQEVEVWGLAALDDLPSDWSWQELRSNRDPKEAYFDVYIKSNNIIDDVGKGRKAIGAKVSAGYQKIKSRCPEVKELEERIAYWTELFHGPQSDHEEVVRWLCHE